MRLQSAYIIPCVCGQTIESHSPVTSHDCEDVNPKRKPGEPTPDPDAPRNVRILDVTAWGTSPE